MSLWIVFALMTGAALLALLWPLRRGWATAAAQTPDDSAVYRDQLQEIERDLAAGSIGANEAEIIAGRNSEGCTCSSQTRSCALRREKLLPSVRPLSEQEAVGDRLLSLH